MERPSVKVCAKCGKEKPSKVEFFHRARRERDGLKSRCKLCILEDNHKEREANPERVRERQRQYHARNRDKLCEGQREQRRAHPERARESNRKWIERNPERHREYGREYGKTHREKRSEYNREWFKENPEKVRAYNRKRREQPKGRLSQAVSAGMRNAVKRNKNGYHWESLVDYTLDELMAHLESQFIDGMSWDNYGLHGWHIDHIRPIASFNFTSPDDAEFKECWALENLQPLWAFDNLSKSSRSRRG